MHRVPHPSRGTTPPPVGVGSPLRTFQPPARYLCSASYIGLAQEAFQGDLACGWMAVAVAVLLKKGRLRCRGWAAQPRCSGGCQCWCDRGYGRGCPKLSSDSLPGCMQPASPPRTPPPPPLPAPCTLHPATALCVGWVRWMRFECCFWLQPTHAHSTRPQPIRTPFLYPVPGCLSMEQPCAQPSGRFCLCVCRCPVWS